MSPGSGSRLARIPRRVGRRRRTRGRWLRPPRRGQTRMTWPPNRGHPPVKEASHVVIGPDNVQSILIAVAHRSTHFASRFSRNARTPSSLSAEPIATGETLASAPAGDDPDVDFRLA